MINHTISFSVECKRPLITKDIDDSLYEYDTEIESITSVFSDLSNSFFERGIHIFLKINDIAYSTHQVELSIFLESFYDLVLFTTNNSTQKYTLEFYEQGFNYLFSFSKIDQDFYYLEIINGETPNVNPISYHSSLLDLHLVLFTFYSRVIFLTKRITPSIAKSDMYIEWQSSIEPLFTI